MGRKLQSQPKSRVSLEKGPELEAVRTGGVVWPQRAGKGREGLLYSSESSLGCTSLPISIDQSARCLGQAAC